MLINLSALKLKDQNNINEVKNLEQDLHLSHPIITASTSLIHINNERFNKAEIKGSIRSISMFYKKSFYYKCNV